MTLILEPDVDMVKMYHHAKNKISLSNSFKSYSQNRQTDTHTHTTKTLPHTREVINNLMFKHFFKVK